MERKAESYAATVARLMRTLRTLRAQGDVQFLEQNWKELGRSQHDSHPTNQYASACNRSRAASAVRCGADLALISGRYRNKGPVSRHPVISGTAAIWVRDGTILRVLTQGRGDNFVWIQFSGITFFRVHLTPKETMPDFRRRLDALEGTILRTDFNARALEWGMPHIDL